MAKKRRKTPMWALRRGLSASADGKPGSIGKGMGWQICSGMVESLLFYSNAVTGLLRSAKEYIDFGFELGGSWPGKAIQGQASWRQA